MSIHLYLSQLSRDVESLDRIFSRNTNNVEEDAGNTNKHNLMSNEPIVRQKGSNASKMVLHHNYPPV